MIYLTLCSKKVLSEKGKEIFKMIEFLNEYKEVLVSGLAVILTLICMLIKRKPKTIEEFALILNSVLNDLPSLINKVEVPGNGLAKKKEVRSLAISLCEAKLGRHLSSHEEDIAFVNIDKQVEDILTTPQKKGVSKC